MNRIDVLSNPSISHVTCRSSGDTSVWASGPLKLIDPRSYDTLQVKKLHDDAILPTKSNDGDLGYDLYALEDVECVGGRPTKIRTGIACQFPIGYGAIIKDRSGLSSKMPLRVAAGVIDNGYVGEIVVVMANYSNNSTVSVPKGAKMAQMVMIPVTNFDIQEVTEIESSDSRGTLGFGSTGK